MSEKMAHVKAGSIVQIDPLKEGRKMFAGCLLVVTEVHGWGVQGYVQMPGDNENIGGQAYLRVKWDDFEPCGDAVWMTK